MRNFVLCRLSYLHSSLLRLVYVILFLHHSSASYDRQLRDWNKLSFKTRPVDFKDSKKLERTLETWWTLVFNYGHQRLVKLEWTSATLLVDYWRPGWVSATKSKKEWTSATKDKNVWTSATKNKKEWTSATKDKNVWTLARKKQKRVDMSDKTKTCGHWREKNKNVWTWATRQKRVDMSKNLKNEWTLAVRPSYSRALWWWVKKWWVRWLY